MSWNKVILIIDVYIMAALCSMCQLYYYAPNNSCVMCQLLGCNVLTTDHIVHFFLELALSQLN